MHRWREHDGQAAVELVAMIPIVILLAAALWQAVVAGPAVWVSGGAARAAARAAGRAGGPGRGRERPLWVAMPKRRHVERSRAPWSAASTSIRTTTARRR